MPRSPVTLAFLTEQLELADYLLFNGDRMFEPQDLPGRYGRVVASIDRLLAEIRCEAVLGGGWAVWHPGYVGRVTQDIDIALPADRIDEFLAAAAMSDFDVLHRPEGRWPKMVHVPVDILPEGKTPGTQAKKAPTTIPHPSKMGADGFKLRYMDFPSIVELKIAAGRGRDEADVIELLRANPERIDEVRDHLAGVHADYAVEFDQLARRAREQEDK